MSDPFRCIAADPPWNETGGGKIKRGADRHYPLLSTKQIVEVMKGADLWRPAESAHLWLWVTNNFLEDGLEVVDALGFRYVSNVAWIKLRENPPKNFEPGADHLEATYPWAHVLARASLQIGLGQYLRGSHELLLFAVRGDFMKPAVAPPSVIFAERGEHSAKPVESYELIEKVSPGPRVEFFARSRRPGWEAFGNEIDNGS
jgi:N6-adenosine-specific RNA methylase IME4